MYIPSANIVQQAATRCEFCQCLLSFLCVRNLLKVYLPAGCVRDGRNMRDSRLSSLNIAKEIAELMHG